MRRAMAYWLFNLAGRLLPADERARLLRVLRTGTHEESAPVDEVVHLSPAVLPESLDDLEARYQAAPYPKCSERADHPEHPFTSAAGWDLTCPGLPR